MASSTPVASESPVADAFEEDDVPSVSPTAAIKAAVVRITAAATGGAVLGGALGFGLGFVAREGTKVAMRESAFGLKTVAVMSAVYAATSAAIENLRNDLLDSAKPGLAGCAAGLAASVPGPPMAMLQGCAAFGLLSFVFDFFAPAEASASPLALTNDHRLNWRARSALKKFSARPESPLDSLLSLALPTSSVASPPQH
ncbi:hypothetical protein CLOM_g5745 [Closterium sp. NIES-68]|nr:hypothetical protein CLOM_g5745 [Closterium sp. NIES-68]GJP73792.1 hypothetical protein CLOP_g4475 [Closterium sp. NIES-67]